MKRRVPSLVFAALLSCCTSAIAQQSQEPQQQQQFLKQQPNSSLSDRSAEAQARYAELNQRLAKLDASVMQSMAEQRIPGYCIAVIKNGEVIFQKAYGVASFERRQPVTPDTVFGLASLTKTFTAFTLLSLYDKGLINLDDPLAKYIDGLTPPYRRLTLRQLASMTAGVPSKVSQEVPWKDQLDILDHTPLVSAPGSQFLYSNFSYRLLGSVIAKVTGRPYLEVVGATLLGPLQMNDTATTVLLQPTGRVAQAYGDNMGNGPLRAIEYKNPAVSFSAGMLASTNNDLIRYVQGLLSKRFLSPEAYKILWYTRPPLSTGEASPWAFGWRSGRSEVYGGQLLVAMNGGTPGVASSIIILPESNSAVIALCNLRKPPVYEVAKTAARIVFSEGADNEAEQPMPGADEE